MTAPTRKNASPLRGIAIGLVLSVILFAPLRHLLIRWIGLGVQIGLGVIAGTVVAVVILSFATTRR